MYSLAYNMTANRTGVKIKRFREEREMTQEQLAKKSGVARVTIAQLEVGIRKNPMIQTRKKLAKALGVSITELLD